MDSLFTALSQSSPLIIAGLFAIGLFVICFSALSVLVEKVTLRDRVNVATGQARSRRAAQESIQSRKNIQFRKSESGLQDVIKKFNLNRLVNEAMTKGRLVRAGYRGPRPFSIFLLSRAVTPVICMFITSVYFLSATGITFALSGDLAWIILSGVVGFFLPSLWLTNAINKRQDSIRAATSECLDFMLVMVEAGMSVENALQVVAREIGHISEPLAEELAITTAELSYLQSRRQALENMSRRIGLDTFKALSTALVQADRHGASVGQTLRIVAHENRNNIVAYIERQGAALPPKMVFPMIFFLLPSIFVVMLGPSLPSFQVLMG